MPISLHTLPQPANVGMLDLNGAGAFAAAGITLRDYPGLVPSVHTALAYAGAAPLVLRPWQRTLRLHAELAVVVGQDTSPGTPAGDSLLGYVLSLALLDSSFVDDLKAKVPRDVQMNAYYAQYIDESRQIGSTILSSAELPSLNQLVLTVHVPGRPAAAFPQGDLLFDGRRFLNECGKLIGFRRGDIFCLGPSAAPLVIEAGERLPAGTILRVEGAPFPSLTVPILDLRDPANNDPWPGCQVDFVRRYPHLRH